ncbi:PAS domain-containing protein [Aliiroseovarius crassostreae]|nr:PAS domain-containing protein [Aliiroseovarius crassostreae]
MTMIERRKDFRPETGEAPFHLNEIFFSRTDERGIIRSGNDIFKRVAHYEWSEIIGHPHNIVRHPDMPKGIFWLIWDALKKGNPISGYVKNRAKDGLHYWVFAAMLPFGNGYLSARIKPSCGKLELIEKLYSEVLQTEQNTSITPQDSATLLLEKLAEHGYASYKQFMAQSLVEEMISRDKKLEHPSDRAIHNFQQMHQLSGALLQQTQQLISQFEAMRTVPHNLRVIASRLEPTGGPVSTLSQNYGIMSREMSQWFETHVLGENSNFSTIRGAVESAMTMSGMAKLLKECAEQLHKERRSMGENVSITNERRYMDEIAARYVQKCDTCFHEVKHEADRITKACAIMNRHVLGLSTTRVMCKIESARRPDAGDALDDIISQLMTFQNRIKHQLDSIATLGEDISQLRV